MGKELIDSMRSGLKQLGLIYIEIFKEIILMFKQNYKKYLRSVCIGVGAFVLCCGLAAGIFGAMGVYNRYIFTTENWNKYESCRINMIENMESKHEIKGMTKKQVENLLGKPNSESLKKDCEYLDLSKCDYDKVVEYQLNKGSKSITDMIAKNYVIAYKEDKAVFAKVLIADKIGNK